jgi:hypothetical protein
VCFEATDGNSPTDFPDLANAKHTIDLAPIPDTDDRLFRLEHLVPFVAPTGMAAQRGA